MISRGLLISLVVTGVSTACLWLYFRNRLGDVEKKVDLMFDFIQDHEQRQMASKGGYDDINVSFSDKNEEERESEENNQGGWDNEANSQPDLIQVSEDEDSDEDETEESDSDEEEEEEGEKADVENAEEIVLEPIKSDIQIEDKLNELNEVESVPVEDNSEIKLQSAEIDSLDEMSDVDDDEEVEVEVEETKTDYSKLTVAVLKELANKKGLSGYKSLKKAALIKLIEDN